jgi:hypothetical protein
MNTSIQYIDIPHQTSTIQVIKTHSLSEYHVSGFTHCLYDNRKKKKKSSDFTVKLQALSLERECISEKSTLWLNFQTKAAAYRGMSRTERAQAQHRQFYKETRLFFDFLIEENRDSITSSSGHQRTKKPTFYTCGIRLPKVRKFAEQAAALLIMKDDKPFLYAVAIGNIQYSFYAQYDEELRGDAFCRITVEDYDFSSSEAELDDVDIFEEIECSSTQRTCVTNELDINESSTNSSCDDELKILLDDLSIEDLD